MLNRALNISILYIFLFTITLAQNNEASKVKGESFAQFIFSWMTSAPKAQSGIYEVPDSDAFRSFSKVYQLFKKNLFDSCNIILEQYNYELMTYKDSKGGTFDVFKEKYPVSKGWGTFIYNRDWRKRLHIHINHPLDDPHALYIGTKLFLNLNAEWLLIAGTSKNAVPKKFTADVGRVPSSMFQRWHELISSLTHVAISLHSYDQDRYPFPISVTDIIVSNGRTTDYQWGISQLSLGFRDTMRMEGYICGLAMYDSGYARLSGGWNHQGIFSNDSIGFGHWLYVELSRKVRENQKEYTKLFRAFEKALDITGKKVSHYVNRGFGLVSPRVIKMDSVYRLFFPPDNNIYKIVAFDEKKKTNDTIDLRIGNWLDLLNKQNQITSVKLYDSLTAAAIKNPTAKRKGKKDMVLTRIVEQPLDLKEDAKYRQNIVPDSGQTTDDDDGFDEPIQVHRIPLRPVIRQTYANQYSSNMTVFRWEGIVSGKIQPSIPVFEFQSDAPQPDQQKSLPKFLIPLLSSAYNGGKSRYVGIHMTDILVNEIARLVYEYQVMDRDIGLLAEEVKEGEYYLRIFPTASNAVKTLAAGE